MAESCLFFVGNFPTTTKNSTIFYQNIERKEDGKKKEKEIFFAEKKTLLTSTCVLLLCTNYYVSQPHINHHGENYRPENRTSFTAAAATIEKATVSL